MSKDKKQYGQIWLTYQTQKDLKYDTLKQYVLIQYIIPLGLNPLNIRKESGIFPSIGVVAQSEQGIIRHRMFPKDHTAPYAP